MPSLVHGSKSLNPAMQGALEAGRRVADYSMPVLLIGETGVGKEWLARQIHASSPRSSETWTKVYCGSIDPEELGKRIQNSTGGTICLQDIDQASLDLQNSLVDWIEQGWQVSPSAATSSSPRLIATTTRSPNSLLRDRLLRQDLYLLLCPASIDVPPLRRRIQDIPGLAEHFLSQSVKMISPECQKRFTPRGMQDVVEYSWPGNLDQLRSCIQRAVMNSEGPELAIDIDKEKWLWDSLLTLEPQPLGANQVHSVETVQASLSPPLSHLAGASLIHQLVRRGILEADKARVPLHQHVVSQVEKELIAQVLSECEQIQTKAAIRLGINRNTLHKKVKEYDLAVEANGSSSMADTT